MFEMMLNETDGRTEGWRAMKRLLCNFRWAFADSVLHRLAPLWVGALGLEFTWDYVLQGPSISTDPAELVKCKSLGLNASKIWVNVSKVDDAKVWRPNSEVNFISDAIGTIVGWTNDKIVYV